MTKAGSACLLLLSLGLSATFLTQCGSTPCPTVNGIDPAGGPAGGRIAISGDNLSGVLKVTFSGNVDAQFVSNSNTQITATVPGGAATGPITLSKTRCGEVPTPTFTVNPGGNKSKVGIFRQNFLWMLDVDGNEQLNTPPDRTLALGGIAGDVPVAGDWNGDGRTKAGVYRQSNGLFVLDYDGDGQVTAADKVYDLGVGKSAGDLPVVGDWNGDGRASVGLFRRGSQWLLDEDGDGAFKQGVDKTYAFGGIAGDVPVVGDWTGTGKSKIGVVRRGFFWVLDADGNGSFDGAGPGPDLAFAFGGSPGDVPVVGDWNGDGKSKVGVFRGGSLWVLDANGNHQFDGLGAGQDRSFSFGGVAGDRPVIGKW